jgi:hypothetical protein
MPNQKTIVYWRDRAEEAQVMPANIRNPECRRIMGELAAAYEHLAKLTTEFKAAAETPPISSEDRTDGRQRKGFQDGSLEACSG